MRERYLPFALPDLDGSELAGIVEVMNSGWMTTGPKVAQFEKEFASYVGAEQAVAVNSGTAALQVALKAVGVEPGDTVLTTPYTFAGTADAILNLGAIPMFVDVESDTLNINPWGVEEAVENLRLAGRSRPKALIPVHLAGHPCDMETLGQIADQHALHIVEDAAHALPASYRDTMVGASSRSTGCFSFYATKTLTTGEGGMITTADEELARQCRLLTLHGLDRDAWSRRGAKNSWYYKIVVSGYKCNMMDIAAAIGLAQIRRVEGMWKRRTEIATGYNNAFSNLPGLEVPIVRPRVEHSWHAYLLRLNCSEEPAALRDEFIEELKKRNIGASVHFVPLHLHRLYRETYGYEPQDFPIAFREYQREISLPIYSKMTDEDVHDVICTVTDLHEHYRSRLA